MPIRKVPFVPGEYYHLYNRGNSKQKIFRCEEDYSRFLALLYVANGTNSIDLRTIKSEDIYTFDRGEEQVAIGAYCLMPNHFHILLTPLNDDGVKNFMLKLSTGYSMYFNKKYFRTGSLFEGRFKSEHAAEDRYLKYLFSYIHLNPVKLIQSDWREVGTKNMEATLQYLNNYQYSSFLDNSCVRPQTSILNRNSFPKYFDSKSEVDRELIEWLSYKEVLTKARPS
jgi:REP element-mobilizing transposase RayT